MSSPIPSLPAQNSTSWYSYAQGLDAKARAVDMFGAVYLDSFQTGSLTDDQLLSAAMTAVAADTYPRTIQLSNRLYSFATGNLTPFEGMRISGAWGFSNPERNSGTKVATPVQLSMTGPWFTTSSTVFGCSFRNLALEGSGTNATFLSNGSSGLWDCLLVENLYASSMRSIMGTQSQKLLITAATFTGVWEINNCYAGAFHMGGSDNTFTWSCLLDSGTAFNSAGGSSGQAHFWCDYLEKTYVGPMYITAEGAWRGIRVDGPSNPGTSGGSNMGSVQFVGLRAEGRNPGAPCTGSVLVVNGGSCTINGVWMAYGMSSPGTGENGFITHNGGYLDVSGVMYDATTQAQTTSTSTPFVYTAGGTGLDCIVTRIKTGSRGSVSWSTNRPIVARASAGAENRITDGTVSLITV